MPLATTDLYSLCHLVRISARTLLAPSMRSMLNITFDKWMAHLSNLESMCLRELGRRGSGASTNKRFYDLWVRALAAVFRTDSRFGEMFVRSRTLLFHKLFNWTVRLWILCPKMPSVRVGAPLCLCLADPDLFAWLQLPRTSAKPLWARICHGRLLKKRA